MSGRDRAAGALAAAVVVALLAVAGIASTWGDPAQNRFVRDVRAQGVLTTRSDAEALVWGNHVCALVARVPRADFDPVAQRLAADEPDMDWLEVAITAAVAEEHLCDQAPGW